MNAACREARSSRLGQWIVVAAAPVHALLAVRTDLSPDEAYYLCAARAAGVVPPIVDHPPLLPWMLRLVDRASFLPVELRVRLIPITCSLALGLLCVELARRRGAGRAGRAFAGWIMGFALLPMTAGFVATPDGPALLAILAAMLWASPAVSESREGTPGRAAEPLGSPSHHRSIAASLATGLALAAGALSKVVVIPVAVLVVACARERSKAERAGVLAPALLCAPLLVPSLRFQLDHAFVAPTRSWSAGGALGALAEAAFVQALLWSPGVVAWGSSMIPKLPLFDRALFLSLSALVGVSALLRALPPEANWWAPAALVLVVAASIAADHRSPKARAAALGAMILPTTIALLHVLRPFLPLPPRLDPTARLHGWREGPEPLDAAGVGPYGPAAERCIYRHRCKEIDNYFNKITDNTSSYFHGSR